ncbi:hypothetical protein TWF696_002626 [Orbilia brochopaga]|uniref:Uncharacterized protein n=1 Tax=Orbilia brochopaga TaxID=3140254 RepID=A0AAV9U647_9PEZI
MSASNGVVAGSASSVAAADQFIADLMNNGDLYDQYSTMTNLAAGATPDPTTVTNWLQQKGYNTTCSDLAAAMKIAHGKDLSFFSGMYNTQYEDGTAGPTITISNGTVTVDQTVINFPTFNQGILSWTEQSETTNASLNMFKLVGLNLKQANGSAQVGLVKNGYLGAQFRGTYWPKGAQKPSSPNFTGRQGKFPKWKSSTPANSGAAGTASTVTVSPTKGPLQAATLKQWADTYRIYTLDPSTNHATPTTNSLTIGKDGSVTYANVAIKVPRFSNDKLQWFVSDGNSLNVDINLSEKNLSTANSSWTGHQFYARNWGPGQQAPTTYNWFGAVSAGFDPGPVKQQGDGLAALAQVANRAIDIYLMQMQMKFYFDMAKMAFQKVLAPLFKKIVQRVKAWRKGPEVENPEENPVEPTKPEVTESGEPNESGDPNESGEPGGPGEPGEPSVEGTGEPTVETGEPTVETGEPTVETGEPSIDVDPVTVEASDAGGALEDVAGAFEEVAPFAEDALCFL